MNYNDQLLENKAFNFFKQLMYNLALGICIMLVGVLILNYGFKFRFYEVLSTSEAPILNKGDMVIVKAQKEYKVGELIKFDTTANKTFPTTHRLIAIITEGKNTYYICHGDNVQNLDGTPKVESDWDDDIAYIKKLQDEGKTYAEIASICGVLIQAPTFNQIEGKVVGVLSDYGTYVNFIRDHALLVIALVCGVWCVCSVVQNEIEIKKYRRLF